MYNYEYYDYGYGYDSVGSTATGLFAFGAGLLIMWLIVMAIAVFSIVCMWRIFTKAGKPGWAAIIPVYNIIVMLEIAELPMWYIALFFVPVANIYAIFKIYIEIAHKFGKSTGFGVGMVFLAPVFMAMLAFGKNVKFEGGQVNTQPVQPQQNVPVQPMNVQPQPAVQPVMPEVQPTITPFENSMSSQLQPVPPVVPVQPVEQPVNPVVQSEPIVQPVINEPAVQPMNVPPQPAVQPKFCTKCGAQTLPESKFCVKCGNQL